MASNTEEIIRQVTMPLHKKVRGVIQIPRPELPLAAGMCVVIGQLLALGAAPPPDALILGFTTGFFLSASALVTNDYFDLEAERITAAPPTRGSLDALGDKAVGPGSCPDRVGRGPSLAS
ncbi:MAG: hypothetical protein IPM39_26325 [Chloroflexi bacterium]|nr:hypothetical protein [Chloroflexota bacterium]